MEVKIRVREGERAAVERLNYGSEGQRAARAVYEGFDQQQVAMAHRIP